MQPGKQKEILTERMLSRPSFHPVAEATRDPAAVADGWREALAVERMAGSSLNLAVRLERAAEVKRNAVQERRWNDGGREEGAEFYPESLKLGKNNNSSFEHVQRAKGDPATLFAGVFSGHLRNQFHFRAHQRKPLLQVLSHTSHTLNNALSVHFAIGFYFVKGQNPLAK